MSTENEKVQFGLNETRYNNGVVESVYYRKQWDGSRKKALKSGDNHNYDRSCRRSKKTIKQKVYQSCSDRILTLTYRENKTDRAACWRDFVRYARLIREKFGTFAYVVVSERQKRGAIHFHIAVAGHVDVVFHRQAWRSVVGEGNIDVSYRPDQPITKLARYLVKYIVKDILNEENIKGQNRYRVSQGIESPEILKRQLPYISQGARVQVLSSLFFDRIGKLPESVWVSGDLIMLVGNLKT
jgi:hypothetical protein